MGSNRGRCQHADAESNPPDVDGFGGLEGGSIEQPVRDVVTQVRVPLLSQQPSKIEDLMRSGTGSTRWFWCERGGRMRSAEHVDAECEVVVLDGLVGQGDHQQARSL